MTAADSQPPRLSRAAFQDWTRGRPGRWERLDGRPVAMAPERIGHARLKAAVWLALRQAITAVALPCEALPDGVTVEIDDDTDYEPDAVVDCGPPLPPQATAAARPLIVVEVLSPATGRTDTGLKLDGYFRLPSVAHYLIFHASRKTVIHHHRQADGTILTRIVAGGPLRLDPPGLALDIDALYRDVL